MEALRVSIALTALCMLRFTRIGSVVRGMLV